MKSTSTPPPKSSSDNKQVPPKETPKPKYSIPQILIGCAQTLQRGSGSVDDVIRTLRKVIANLENLKRIKGARRKKGTRKR